MKALEIDVEELQELAESTGNRGHIGALKAKKSALADLLGISAQGALVRSRFRNISEMDASSRFFFGLERKNGQKRLIHSMRSDTGQILSESTDIRRHAVGFYSSLFQSELGEEQEVSHGFYEGLPKVEQESSAELEADVSLDELHTALQSMENGKAPGIDGLPVEFYKTMWSVMGEDLLMVLRDSLTGGQLPLSCRRAVLTLLPKKGDLMEIKNWRPVSLLCTEYKLLSKVLATRLRE
ncbi:hypothetical protein NHX12_000164, partial [Muraenolepis orangiensis]